MTNTRIANGLGFLACAGLMAYAIYAQYGLGLEPCPLCILQRVAVIALGGLFLAAALHPAGTIGRRVYAILLGLVALVGSGEFPCFVRNFTCGRHSAANWNVGNLESSQTPVVQCEKSTSALYQSNRSDILSQDCPN